MHYLKGIILGLILTTTIILTACNTTQGPAQGSSATYRPSPQVAQQQQQSSAKTTIGNTNQVNTAY